MKVPGLALGGRGQWLLLAVAGALAFAALLGGDAGSAAARALAVAALLAAGVLVVRRRQRPPVALPRLTVVERAPLAKDVGLALVRAEGRRLLVGFGPGGTTLVADVTSPTEEEPS